MNRKEITKLYGNDIFRFHSVGSISNIIKHRQDNDLSLDKIILKDVLKKSREYSLKNGSKITLERYNVVYDYYGQREYKKYVKKKCSEWCSTKYNHDTKSLKHFIEKYGNIEVAFEKYKESCHTCGTTLRIQYYIDKGMSEDQAKAALKDRQRTFSLNKCIKKYGKAEGVKVWRRRQIKWQNTLLSLPEEIRSDINFRKGQTLHNNLKRLKTENPIEYFDKIKSPLCKNSKCLSGYLYYICFSINGFTFYKIGITRFSDIDKRFNFNTLNYYGLKSKILFFVECKNLKEAFTKEQFILKKFKTNRINIDFDFFKTTEAFNIDVLKGFYGNENNL